MRVKLSAPPRKLSPCKNSESKTEYADMAELADALDSGSNGRKAVQVQVLLSAPNSTNPNPRPVGEGFGFVIYFDDPNFNLKQEKTELKLRRSRK